MGSRYLFFYFCFLVVFVFFLLSDDSDAQPVLLNYGQGF